MHVNPAMTGIRRTLFGVVALLVASQLSCKPATAPVSTLLSANAVDPNDVNAVSAFNSCQGHAYPEQNSPNSGKNYFWPNSTNFSSNNLLKEFAACAGNLAQSSQDKSADQQDRGQTIHLYCDNSSTRLKYFHVTFSQSILGTHVHAGDFIGYGSTLGTGQARSTSWKFSSNIDIAVSEENDDRTEDYFSRLDGPTFAAWGARGVTSLSQTTRAGNVTCSGYNASTGPPDIVFFTPER